MAPRKKVKAFTLPKTTKVKATTKHNAESSPLLKLPLEVQTNIFTKLLGDHEIHIKRSGNGQDAVHSSKSERVMNALRTCRQVYIVAAPIFWSTTTFSFEDPKAFTSWMNDRTAYQKRSLRSIHLKVDLVGLPFRVASTDIKHPAKLRDLRLTFCQWYDGGSLSDEYKARFNSIDMMFMDRLRGAERFAILPLKTVEVSIAASTLKPPPPQYQYVPRRAWNQDEVQEFAEMVKRMLLDPDPASTEARLRAQLWAEWEAVKGRYGQHR